VRVTDLAVLGFCMAGASAICRGRATAALGAVGVFYGGNIMSVGEARPPSCLTGTSRTMIGFSGDDSNPCLDVDTIDAELSRTAKTHEFHRYEAPATRS